MGSRVLLMEVDLRRPTIAQRMAIRSRPGLADVLIGAFDLRAVTQSITLDPVSAGATDAATLDVLVAGATMPPNPAALIESSAMESLLEQAKSEYDLIVIDTPPLTAVSDAFPLLGKVDGVVIVGWVGRNRRDVAERLHETLDGAGAPLLGVVANGFNARGLDAYGYDYAYAQGESSAARESSAATDPTIDAVRWPRAVDWSSEDPDGGGGTGNGAEIANGLRSGNGHGSANGGGFSNGGRLAKGARTENGAGSPHEHAPSGKR
jgi:capsular exopolysaccharide synthesis family protein